MSVKIITDSSSDLTMDIAEKYNIEILSIFISDGTREYRDLIDINSEDIFRGQEKGIKYSTSQIPVFEYYNAFKKILDDGDEFIYLALSSGLSGSYNNSLIAIEELKKEYKQNFASVDSKAASLALGLITEYLAKASMKGASFDELIEFSDFLIENVVHRFTVLDLENLYRGGRLSKGAVSIGNLLSLRPIIHVRNGELKLKEIIRGNKMVYKTLTNELIDTMKGYGEHELIYLIYGKDKKYVEPLYEKYIQENNLKKIKIGRVGCTISIHTGFGFFGNGYLKKTDTG